MSALESEALVPALRAVPDLPVSAAVHHPSCPTRVGELPCLCPTSSTPLSEERCPECRETLTVWQAFSTTGWAEWLVCGGCLWRELL